MLKSRMVLAFPLLFGLSFPADATESCNLVLHGPQNIFNILADVLPSQGVSLALEVAQLGEPSMRSFVVTRGTAVVGRVEFDENIVTRSAELTAYDIEGHVLLRSDAGQCSDLRNCQMVRLSTLNNPAIARGPFEEVPFLAIKDLPGHGLRYSVYGDNEHPITWFSNFNEELDWLIRVYRETTNFRSIELLSPFERFIFVIGADPALSPYVRHILAQEVNGRLKLTGAMPSTSAYRLLIMRVMDTYGPAFDDNIVINTGLEPLPITVPLPACS